MALGGSLLFGVSSVADQLSTKQVRTERALSPRILADLARQPLWLTAIGTNVLAFALQVTALKYGSLALVQPLLACDLVFAVLISQYVTRRSAMRRPRAGPLLTGVAATAIGIAGFLAIGQPTNGHFNVSFGVLIPLAAGLVVLVGGCLFLARNARLRPLALALACGVNYGVAAFAVKLVTSEFGGGPAHVFTDWPIYVLAVVGPAGFILNQDAFQQGTFLAPVQAIITTADPVISVALGVLWLGVLLRGGPAQIVGQVVSLFLMTLGIVTIARYAPQCQKPRSAVPAVQQAPSA
jgi:hypothetical protein